MVEKGREFAKRFSEKQQSEEIRKKFEEDNRRFRNESIENEATMNPFEYVDIFVGKENP